MYDAAAEGFTPVGLGQLRDVFVQFAKSSQNSLSYVEFARMFEITNGEHLPEESFGLIVGSCSSVLSFENFCSLYLQVYRDEGVLEGDRVFNADLRRLKQALSSKERTEVPPREKENSQETTARGNTEKCPTPATRAQSSVSGRKASKSQSHPVGAAQPKRLIHENKKLRKKMLATQKHIRGGGGVGKGATSSTVAKRALPENGIQDRHRKMLKTKNFFLTPKEREEQEILLDRKRREGIARSAQEALRVDLEKQKVDHKLFFQGKKINPFFQHVAQRTLAARTKAASITVAAALTGENNALIDVTSLPRPRKWDTADLSFRNKLDLTQPISKLGSKKIANTYLSLVCSVRSECVPRKCIEPLDESTRDIMRRQQSFTPCTMQSGQHVKVKDVCRQHHNFQPFLCCPVSQKRTDGEVDPNLVEKTLDHLADGVNVIMKRENVPCILREQVRSKFRKMVESQANHDTLLLKDSMWPYKYRPLTSSDLCGNNRASSALLIWLTDFLTSSEEHSKISQWWAEDSDSDDESGCQNNTMLLTGPPGSGKTAAVYACAAELDLEVIEINASTSRGRGKILQLVGEATQSHRLASGALQTTESLEETSLKKPRLANTKQNVTNKTSCATKLSKSSIILFEEVDNISLFEDAGDRGFFSAVRHLMKKSKRPIILTANKNTEPLVNLSLKTERFCPLKLSSVVLETGLICLLEGIRAGVSELSSLARLLKCDLRQILLTLQFWGARSPPSNFHTRNTFALIPPKPSQLPLPLCALGLPAYSIVPWMNVGVRNDTRGGKTACDSKDGHLLLHGASMNAPLSMGGFGIDLLHHKALACALFQKNSSELESSNPFNPSVHLSPSITNVVPHSGDAKGGTMVTICGTNFLKENISDVRFGGVSCAAYNVVSDTEILTESPQSPIVQGCDLPGCDLPRRFWPVQIEIILKTVGCVPNAGRNTRVKNNMHWSWVNRKHTLTEESHRTAKYEFNHKGSIGLILIEMGKSTGLKIESITNNEILAAGIVSPGWYLTHVNETCVHRMTLAKTGKLIREADRPMTVTFQNYFKENNPAGLLHVGTASILNVAFPKSEWLDATLRSSEYKRLLDSIDSASFTNVPDFQHNDVVLNGLVDFYDVASSADILSIPIRAGVQGPSVDKGCDVWTSFHNPNEWKIDPRIFSEPRVQDELGSSIAAYLTSLQYFRMHSTPRSPCSELESKLVAGDDDGTIDSTKFGSGMMQVTRLRGERVFQLARDIFPLRVTGIFPGSFQPKKVLEYCGLVGAISAMENVRRRSKSSKNRRRFTHYLDMIGVNNKSIAMCDDVGNRFHAGYERLPSDFTHKTTGL